MASLKSISNKFEKEWLISKPDSIINFIGISNFLAIKIINSKSKVIEGFTKVMLTSKYEDNLKPFVNNEKMGIAYKDGMNNKKVITDSEKLKVETYMEIQKGLFRNLLRTFLEFIDEGIDLFGFPRYENIPTRRKMELLIALNKVILPFNSNSYGGIIYNLGINDYLVENFNWTRSSFIPIGDRTQIEKALNGFLINELGLNN